MTSLTEALAADLDDAFPRLLRLHQDAVFATALRSTRHWQDAEEVAQEAFVRAHRALRSWDVERIRALRPRSWLLSITVNLARNRARDAARRPAADASGGDALEAVPTTADSPEEAAERRDLRRHLLAALDRLPRPQREAIVLRHVAGLPYHEIAATLDAPVGTVKAHVHRGLRAIAAGAGGTLLEVR